MRIYYWFFFLNDPATTEIDPYWHTLSLHYALPIFEGGEILAAVLVEAADLHVLAGQMGGREVDLELGVARVLAVREAAHQLLERVQRLGGHLLVAADVDDLLVVAEDRKSTRLNSSH